MISDLCTFSFRSLEFCVVVFFGKTHIPFKYFRIIEWNSGVHNFGYLYNYDDYIITIV